MGVEVQPCRLSAAGLRLQAAAGRQPDGLLIALFQLIR